MKRKEVDEIKWAGYEIDAPIDKSLFEESLGIFDNVESRKPQNDLVNWDERREMDKASKRSGKYIDESMHSAADASDMMSIKKKSAEPKKQQINEAPEKKEQQEEIDIVAYGAELVDFMENNNV
jgi:hypothetical protein